MSLIRAHQTLLKQMDISDAEIQHRLDLVDIAYSDTQALRDPLTNLFNRRYMHDISVQILASAKRRNARVSIAYFDVDEFKLINDRLGYV
jgi:GGDEF domain-containing protein